MEFEMQAEDIDEIISCNDFQKRVIQNPEPCILEYFASWCPPCKDLDIKKQEFLPSTSKRKGQWQWLRIDADEDEEFIDKQDLAGIPTVILYYKGQRLQYNSKSEYQRWVVLIFCCISGWAYYTCFDFPGILQNQIIDYLSLTSIQYQLLYSVCIFPNIVIPCFAGFFIDKISPSYSIVLFLSMLTFGQSICSFALYNKSYIQLLIGRLVYGLSSDVALISQSVLVTQWFQGKELGFALGCTVTVGRLGTVLSSIYYPKIVLLTQELYIPALIGCVICLVSVILCCFLMCMDPPKNEEQEQQDLNQKQQTNLENQNMFSQYIHNIRKTNRLFWMTCLFTSFSYAIYFPFMMNIQNLSKSMYMIDEIQGGSLYAIPFFIGACLIPFIGILTDKFGNRPILLVLSTCILIIALIMIQTHIQCVSQCFSQLLTPLVMIGLFYSLLAGVNIYIF